ncbi:MAG: Tad domain-containing protein, partial [Candidatus Hadarchaeales archaeon]
MVLFALFVSALLIVFMMVVYDLGILVSLSREAQSLADLAASYGARQVDKSLGPQGMVGFSSDLKERVEDYLYKQLEVRYGENSDRYKVRDLVIECSPPPGTFESLEEFLASPQSFQVRVSFELWADKSLLVVPEESG